MKIAVVYNRESKSVINLFGVPNREKIGQKTIRRVCDALKAGGHQVIALEGDKDLVDRLEEFMPRVVKGERPGMVFNVSYGIQGQARYTHVPSILEMVGIPYVASGPLAHSLALDKVVTKMILRQSGLPTPDFAVMDTPESPLPQLRFPLIVKPKNEAVSFGLRIVHDESELREGAAVIFEKFGQPVLVERYVEGRELNVGLLGNDPPEALPVVELSFGDEGPPVYTYEDKTGRSGRTIQPVCPAPVDESMQRHAQDIARRAFVALGCADCARVDMRLDSDGELYILEVNSLPSLGEHGSYLVGAAYLGLDFAAVINRLVEVASTRYFGTPHPPRLNDRKADPSERIFSYLTERRDRIEKRLGDLVALPSRTADPVGLRQALKHVDATFTGLGLRRLEELSDERYGQTWATDDGLDGGTLCVLHLDVPLDPALPRQAFRREPELIRGEGVAISRAPLAALEFALRALRHQRRLRKRPLGVLCYTDEGRDCRYSGELIRRASSRASRVLVLRPAFPGDVLVTQRRGQRKYRLQVEDRPRRPGAAGKRPEVLRWTSGHLEEMAKLSSRRRGLAVSVTDLKTSAYPMLLPHEVRADLIVSYLDGSVADRTDQSLREILGRGGPRWSLETISDRPPLRDRSDSPLVATLREIASRWEIPLEPQSSLWPSAAGLVPPEVEAVCGLGPEGRELYTPQEAVSRISLMQRTLLLALFLAEAGKRDRDG
jgi:D-alanine-D-alanine ligase